MGTVWKDTALNNVTLKHGYKHKKFIFMFEVGDAQVNHLQSATLSDSTIY